jgi:hypothetical protein
VIAGHLVFGVLGMTQATQNLRYNRNCKVLGILYAGMPQANQKPLLGPYGYHRTSKQETW